MNNSKWKNFFLALDTWFKERSITGRYQVKGYYEVKFFTDPELWRAGYRVENMKEDGFCDSGFVHGGPVLFSEIEAFHIRRIITKSPVTGGSYDEGLTEELFQYLSSIAKFPIEISERGITIYGK